MNQFNEIFKKRLEERKLSVDEEKLCLFETYATELKDWNTRINLTAIKDDLDIIDKHLIDSLLPLKFDTFGQGITVADVGTGGGFPGIPLKICRPDIHLTLIESIGKKANFLKHIIDKLNLENSEVINERAEIIGNSADHREKYDLVVARCVARLPTLCEYCIPLAKVGGKFIAYKGQEAETEFKEANSAIEKLGGKFDSIEYDDTYTDRRALIFIKKVKHTPKQYPRQSGKPSKKPL